MAHKSNAQVRTGTTRGHNRQQGSKRLREIVQYQRKLVVLDADCRPVIIWVSLPAGFVPDLTRSDIRRVG